MSRPLELTIHPQPVADHPVTFRDTSTGTVTEVKMYQNGGILTSYPPTLDKSKRFTDAELAAECHAATLAVYRAKVHHQGSPVEQMVAMQRFATLPHYDEDHQ